MSEEFKYMDASFRKMSEEFQVPYNPTYWNDVKSKLDDDMLDSAFKVATGSIVVPSFDSISGELDNAFMDEAFSSAANSQSTVYNSTLFADFRANSNDLEMNDAFVEANKSLKATYEPQFWGPADAALQKEGLHYEYKSTYWNDAKKMLDVADRRFFFFKWSAIASLLLLISFGGVYQFNNTSSSEMFDAKFAESKTQEISNPNNNSFDLIGTDGLKEIVLNKMDGLSSLIPLTGTEERDVSNSSLSIGRSFETSSTALVIGNSSDELNTHTGNRENGNEELKMRLFEDGITSLRNSLDFTSMENIENNKEFESKIQSNSVKIEKFLLTPIHSLSFVAHLGIGNKYGSVEFIPTWRNTFGFEYMNTSYRRHRRFEFGASFLINHIRQNSLGTERRVNVFTQEGGVNTSWYKLQLIDMLYANLNLLVNYKIDEKNKIKFGFGYERLISVKSNMSFKIQGDENITTVNNNWGVKDGLNRNDFRVSIGYERQLSNRFSFQIMGNYGLWDRSDNTFLQDEFKDNEMNVTVGIRYTFMRNIK